MCFLRIITAIRWSLLQEIVTSPECGTSSWNRLSLEFQQRMDISDPIACGSVRQSNGQKNRMGKTNTPAISHTAITPLAGYSQVVLWGQMMSEAILALADTM